MVKKHIEQRMLTFFDCKSPLFIIHQFSHRVMLPRILKRHHLRQLIPILTVLLSILACNNPDSPKNDNEQVDTNKTTTPPDSLSHTNSIAKIDSTLDNNLEKNGFIDIELECINKASIGGTWNITIDTQEEYDSLYYYTYTKRLNDWLNHNYNSLIDGVRKTYPAAAPDKYDSILMNDYIYNFAPYMQVRNCSEPSIIDFKKYTLLGQNFVVGGCSHPKLETKIYVDRNKKELTFLINVETYGTCEMAITLHEWVLVPKLGDGYKIIYKLEEINIK